MELSCENSAELSHARFAVTAGLCLLSPAAWSAHGYALWGDLKYPVGFANLAT